ncbi:MAG: AsmA family protein, partial [Roseobacter sp.]|nr:AsmA family protein [Roseobacter sp.]
MIDGDVHLSLAPQPRILLTDMRLPAKDFQDLDLAKLDSVYFPISASNRLHSGILFPEIEARGLTVTLFQNEDGATTWIKRSTEKISDTPAETTRGQTDLIAFLGQREITFADMSVHAENRSTGFEFDFELDTFTVEQDVMNDVAKVLVRSSGQINEQPFAFSGDFPMDAGFEAQGNIGDLTFDMDGERPPGAERWDFDAGLRLETSDTQNLLDMLRLRGKLPATAKADVRLVRRNTRLDAQEIDLQMRLSTGETARLSGMFADARFGHNFDLSLLVDFVGENDDPPPAILIKDIRPKSAEIRVVASEGIIEIERLAVQTNAFEEEIRDIGPFRVASVTRSAEGQLKLDGATFVIGPQDRPYMLAEGSIDSLLTLEGYSLSGALDLPAKSVLRTLRLEQAERFGRLTGALEVRETDGEPELQLFELNSQDTDLWQAKLNLKSTDLGDYAAQELYANISAPDGMELLQAMQLEPVDIGFIGYEVYATREKNAIETNSLLSAGETAIETGLSLKVLRTGPELRGWVHSETLQISDVRHAILSFVQLARVKSLYMDAKTSAAAVDDDGFQPLVLDDEKQIDPEAEQTEGNLSDFQPLVLPDTTPPPVEQEAVSEFQPLVMTDSLTSIAIADVLNPEHFVRLADVEIDIDIARIAGQAGVSKLDTQLEIKSGNLRLRPVRLEYNKGHADVAAHIDVIDAPEWLRITGTTGGWDFGKILAEVGANFGAYGTLNGQFDLTGKHASALAFAKSMRGTATIDMRDGRIDTGLIELAGLGVLPWLFSKERQEGYADIVCLTAPLEIANGRITTG